MEKDANDWSAEQRSRWERFGCEMRMLGFYLPSLGVRVPGLLEKMEAHPDMQEVEVRLNSWYPR